MRVEAFTASSATNRLLPGLPWVTVGLIALLLLLAPYAMRFSPFEGIYEFGVYRAPYENDPLLFHRTALVWFGIGATAAAAIECVVLFFRRPNRSTFCIGIAAWFACAVLGLRSLPYWVSGVYAVYSGRMQFTDLDPGVLEPIASLPDLWFVAVLLLYPLSFIAVPAGIVGSILLSQQRTGMLTAIPAICSAIGFLFMVAFSPDYVYWFLD